MVLQSMEKKLRPNRDQSPEETLSCFKSGIVNANF
jgi:hypothetical protein